MPEWISVKDRLTINITEQKLIKCKHCQHYHGNNEGFPDKCCPLGWDAKAEDWCCRGVQWQDDGRKLND